MVQVDIYAGPWRQRLQVLRVRDLKLFVVYQTHPKSPFIGIRRHIIPILDKGGISYVR